ncbi:hypothetical protein CT0861_10181 [Colletotrichum tofieldiae]|uniref:Uncharacterized protein n=1 Tax=Colletotrichum tofieldiae TaxID=708197 RepID=A0A161VI40_9PEZI|nr:hypothetical protein CT0861_10181 [Colletotrichum tofieldiae]
MPVNYARSAVKVINNTAGPNGIIPTLLVFSAYPRITNNSALSPNIVKRTAAIRKTDNKLCKHFATRVKKKNRLALIAYLLLTLYYADPNDIYPANAAPNKDVTNNANKGNSHAEDTIVVITTLRNPVAAKTALFLRYTCGQLRKNPITNALLQKTNVLNNLLLLPSSAFIFTKEKSDKALVK